MQDKTAIEILERLLEKYPLDAEEAEAIRSAIGILAWSKLSEGRLNNLKKSRTNK